VPAWLAILLLMLIPILVVNPSPGDDAWFRSLRRPSWFRFYLWVPQLWLLIDIGIYVAALRSWTLSRSPPLVVAPLLLVLLVESCNWFLCRSRRLGAVALMMLGIWAYGLAITLSLGLRWPLAALPLLPFLLWMPVEALAVWQIRLINRKP